MYITYGKVFGGGGGGGGTPNIFMFWLFPEMEAFRSELFNRALIVHTTLYNSA